MNPSASLFAKPLLLMALIAAAGIAAVEKATPPAQNSAAGAQPPIPAAPAPAAPPAPGAVSAPAPPPAPPGPGAVTPVTNPIITSYLTGPGTTIPVNGLEYPWVEKDGKLSVRIRIETKPPVDPASIEATLADAWPPDGFPVLPAVPVKNQGEAVPATVPPAPAAIGTSPPPESTKAAPPLVKLIDVHVDRDSVSGHPALSITAAAANLPQGKYKLAVKWTWKEEKPDPKDLKNTVEVDGGPREEIFTVIRQGATLNPNIVTTPPVQPPAQAKVVLQQLQWVPSCFVEQNPIVRLHLTETSRLTGVYGLTCTVLPDEAAPGDSGSIDCYEIPPLGSNKARAVLNANLKPGDDQRLNISPGGDLLLNLKPTGTFPLKKNKGTLRFNSPQLSSPLLVSYELQAVRPAELWIPLIVAAGVLLGYMIRIVLANLRVLLESRINASKALAALAMERDQIPDGTFRKALDALRAGIETAVKSQDAAAITKAATDAKAGTLTEKTALKTRRDELQAKWGPVFAILNQEWHLPKPVAVYHAAALKVVKEIKKFAEASDIAAATKVWDDETQVTWFQLNHQGAQWLLDMKDYFKALVSFPPPMHASYAGLMEGEVKAWISAYPTPPIEHPQSTDLNASLNLIEGAYLVAQRNVKSIVQSGRDVTSAALALQTLPGSAASAAAFAALDKAMTADGAGITAATDQPDLAIKDLAGSQLVQQVVWKGALKSVVSSPGDPKASKKVEDLIDERQWSEAVKAAAPSAAQPPGSRAEPQLRSLVLEAALPGNAQPGSPLPAPRPLADVIPAFVVLPPLDGSDAEQNAMARTSLVIAAIQSTVIGLILMGTIYGIYADDWTGTWRQMFGLFVVAFSLDLTAGALTTKIEGFGTAISNTWSLAGFLSK